jgi:hypothetical protein
MRLYTDHVFCRINKKKVSPHFCDTNRYLRCYTQSFYNNNNEDKQNKYTTQYVMDTTIRKQTQTR